MADTTIIKIRFKNNLKTANFFGKWTQHKKGPIKFAQANGKMLYGKIICLSQKAKKQIKNFDPTHLLEAEAVFLEKEKTDLIIEFKNIINLSSILVKTKYNKFIYFRSSIFTATKTSFYEDGREVEEVLQYPEYFEEDPYSLRQKKFIDNWMIILNRLKEEEKKGRFSEYFENDANGEKGFIFSREKEASQEFFLRAQEADFFNISFFEERKYFFPSIYLDKNGDIKDGKKIIFETEKSTPRLSYEIIEEKTDTYTRIKNWPVSIHVSGGDGFRPPAHRVASRTQYTESVIKEEKIFMRVKLLGTKNLDIRSGNNIKIKKDGNYFIAEFTLETTETLEEKIKDR